MGEAEPRLPNRLGPRHLHSLRAQMREPSDKHSKDDRTRGRNQEVIIKATAIQQRRGLGGDVYIDGRVEVQWDDGGPWAPLIPLTQFTVDGWYAACAFFEMGTRHAGKTFIMDDRTIPV